LKNVVICSLSKCKFEIVKIEPCKKIYLYSHVIFLNHNCIWSLNKLFLSIRLKFILYKWIKILMFIFIEHIEIDKGTNVEDICDGMFN